MSLLSFDLDMLDEEFIYVPPRPRIVWAVAPAPKPAKACRNLLRLRCRSLRASVVPRMWSVFIRVLRLPSGHA